MNIWDRNGKFLGFHRSRRNSSKTVCKFWDVSAHTCRLCLNIGHHNYRFECCDWIHFFFLGQHPDKNTEQGAGESVMGAISGWLLYFPFNVQHNGRRILSSFGAPEQFFSKYISKNISELHWIGGFILPIFNDESHSRIKFE